MNIYAKFVQPEILEGYDIREQNVVELINLYWGKNSKMPEVYNMKTIMRHPQASYWYAWCVIDGRFPEGEESISKSPFYSLRYAVNVIRGRFELGEPTIAMDRECAGRYNKLFGVYI